MSDLGNAHGDGELGDVERLLETSRPVPRPGFRGDLRRHLVDGRSPATPRRLRLLITAYATSGLALLIIAVIGVAGAGPLGA